MADKLSDEYLTQVENACIAIPKLTDMPAGMGLSRKELAELIDEVKRLRADVKRAARIIRQHEEDAGRFNAQMSMTEGLLRRAWSLLLDDNSPASVALRGVIADRLVEPEPLPTCVCVRWARTDGKSGGHNPECAKAPRSQMRQDWLERLSEPDEEAPREDAGTGED